MLSVEELGTCIERRCSVEAEDALAAAEHVLNFFGYNTRIIDNILERSDRDLFYALQNADILQSYNEEYTTYQGKTYRIFFWGLKEEKIRTLSRERCKSEPIRESEEFKVYEDLPPQVWAGVEDGCESV